VFSQPIWVKVSNESAKNADIVNLKAAAVGHCISAAITFFLETPRSGSAYLLHTGE
jgi:hypothetical protein